MGFLADKRILITGLISNRSIAYGIAQACKREGAELAFTFQNEKLQSRVEKMAAECESTLTFPMDVASDEEIDSAFDSLKQHWDSIDLSQDSIHELWGNISCPTQLHYGADSWASNPEKDGRMKYFGDNVSVKEFQNAGHWLHHDQFELFAETPREFL